MLTLKSYIMSLVKTNGGFWPSRLFSNTEPFNELFQNWPDWNLSFNDQWVPAANVKEEDTEFIVEVSVPGYKKKDIHVEVDNNNIMRIKGEHEQEKEEKKENYMRKEFSSGSFYRAFRLPEAVDEGNINAKCVDGVLKVTLPKKEVAIKKEEVKEIEIA